MRFSALAAASLAVALALALAAPPRAAVRASPELGETVHLDPKRGKVAFSPPGAGEFRQLNGAREVPVGTELRSRTGSVEVTSATGGDKTRTSVWYDFYPDVGGAVRVLQEKSRNAPAEAELVGGLGGCTPLASGSGAAHPVGYGPTSRRQVAINGSGGHRIIGRFSSATSRGTNFDVIDRCDGTLTRVKSGSVIVRDFGREESVVLRAKGRNRYLASATGGA